MTEREKKLESQIKLADKLAAAIAIVPGWPLPAEAEIIEALRTYIEAREKWILDT